MKNLSLIIIFFLITGLILQLKLSAQASFGELDNNKVIYPSPTAASLGKYGEYPVSLYNGLVNIGLDIVTVKSGHLPLNVSLSYHASGNKPSDIPGWVGLGFSLNAGGVITRVIKDLPDDMDGGFYSANEWIQYYWKNNLTEFIRGYCNGVQDPRSDVYQFNFCGKTGEFVFDWDRKIHFKQQVPFKIEALYGPYGFAGFKVTADDGIIYTFEQKERSMRSVFDLTVFNPASSWYLTKIKNLSGDSIVLKYTNPMNKYRYKQYRTMKEVISPTNIETGATDNLNKSTDEVVYLDTIIFNEGKLTFGKSIRQDPVYIPSGVANVEEKKLDLITLKDNNDNIIKQWKFEYFENSTERLKLKNLIVQGSGQTDVQKYSFEYNPLKLPLETFTSGNPYLSNDVDYWGYYNEAGNGNNIIPSMYIGNQHFGKANREINPSKVKAEMLEKITYPTGGYTTFEYESNDYGDQGDSFAKDLNPFFMAPSPEYYEFYYNRDEGGFEVDPATISFTLTEATFVNVKYSCGAVGTLHSWANPGTMYNYDYQLTAGTYTLRSKSLFNTDELLSYNSSDITKAHGQVIVYRTTPLIPIDTKTGPGLRIKSIKNNDGAMTTTRSFEYKLENSSKSSGVLSVFPAFYIPLQKFGFNWQGVYITSYPINDTGEGMPIGYCRVTERFQDNSSIVHTYTSYVDYPDEMMPFLNGPFYPESKLAHMTSNNLWRGLELSTDYYSANGIMQKRISNNYSVLQGSVNVLAIDLKPTVGIIYRSMDNYSSWVDYLSTTLISLYHIRSGFVYKGSTTEELFDKDGKNPIITTVNKYYDNVKHLQPTREVISGSDGSVLTTTTNFPDDYASGVPFIDYMQTNHFSSFPVEQVVYKQKEGNTNIVSGNIITYKTEGTGLPEKLLKLETTNSLSQTSFKFSNRPVGILPPSSQPLQYNPDTRYQPELTYTQYDNKGNPLESVRRDGISTVYLWSYKSQYPIAEIKNATYSQVSGILTQALINRVAGAAEPSAGDMAAINNLRSNTSLNALVTTYTYKPLVGILTATDPSGITTYYDYDAFGRLVRTKDLEGKTIQSYNYNYQTQ